MSRHYYKKAVKLFGLDVAYLAWASGKGKGASSLGPVSRELTPGSHGIGGLEGSYIISGMTAQVIVSPTDM